MEEMKPIPGEQPDTPSATFFPTDTTEFTFGFLILLTGWLVCNSVIYAGFHLGFALFSGAAIICSTAYLLIRGHRLTPYSSALLIISLVICASFARNDDNFVKFVMFCFLVVSANLGLCLLAGQNRRNPKGLSSLLDVPRTVFILGIGRLPAAFLGLMWGFLSSGSTGRKGGAVLLGLVIAVPLLAFVIPLLIRADAAFDALLQQLPDWDLSELLVSLILGSGLAIFLYTRGIALHHAPKANPDTTKRKGIYPLTVNTVLFAVALVYVVYLISQLAYFSGGFSGILPQGYTAAEYARRGFFEMAWLCAINLAILALTVGLVAKKDIAPLLTRSICLFLGIVTLFLVFSASAKMFLYIDFYGLTRLRLLTQVIIFFLGITTILASIWLFAPKLPYMKAILLTALVIGSVVAWADVDTVVARYNVTAYQTGRLETIDVDYLYSLGNGAAPYIAQLSNCSDPEVAENARKMLQYKYFEPCDDFRDWNYVNHLAENYIPGPPADTLPQ